MKELFVGISMLLSVLSTVLSGETKDLTLAQRVYEEHYKIDFETNYDLEDVDYEAAEEAGIYYIERDYVITWIDNDTCLTEVKIYINDDIIGLDSIVDIDTVGDIINDNEFRWFINNESYADSCEWGEVVEALYPGL